MPLLSFRNLKTTLRFATNWMRILPLDILPYFLSSVPLRICGHKPPPQTVNHSGSRHCRRLHVRRRVWRDHLQRCQRLRAYLAEIVKDEAILEIFEEIAHGQIPLSNNFSNPALKDLCTKRAPTRSEKMMIAVRQPTLSSSVGSCSLFCGCQPQRMHYPLSEQLLVSLPLSGEHPRHSDGRRHS